tara:strand:- start:49 stop:582 length:534 start_codon:yes stop_codon:yes gene_type:complete
MAINFPEGWQNYPANIVKMSTYTLANTSNNAWTSIPEGVQSITISFEEVSTYNNPAAFYVQIGDNVSGFLTSGYTGTWIHENPSGTAGGREQDAGFEIYQSGSSYYSTGHAHLSLQDTSSSHYWVCSILAGQQHSPHVAHGAGYKILSGSNRYLDRVRFSIASGVWDAGSVSLHYSF